MAEDVASFDDYVTCLTKKLRSLRHFERCVFSVWCAEHLLTKHEGLVGQSLSESDLQVLRTVLDEIWDVLLTGSIPDSKMLNALDSAFMEVEPDDPLAVIEMHPIVTGVQTCIGLCILACRRNDVRLAQKAGETIIDVLDYELDERDPDYAGDLLPTMFRHPELKQELDVQLAMIKHLQGVDKLDADVRSIFRQ